MSIRRMSSVWENSAHDGSRLLQLLSLADQAGDDGFCWPGIETIARRTRLSERAVLRNNEALEASGELYVDHNRRRGNQYLVIAGQTDEELAAALKTHWGILRDDASEIVRALREKATNPRSDNLACDASVTSEVTSCQVRCDASVISEVTPVSHESSYNRNETSLNHHIDAEQKTPASRKPQTPKVAPSEPIQVYREVMQKFPRRNTWDDITATVIPHNGNMGLWREIVTAWKLHGWNPSNIAGMLDCWRRGEVPKTGYTQKEKRQNRPMTQEEAVALAEQYRKENNEAA